MTAARRVLDGVATALFAAAVAAPVVDSSLRPAVAESARVEGRRPAPWPEWSGEKGDPLAWPQRFSSAFDDRMGLRDHLLRARGILLLTLMGVSPTPLMIAGEDGWLFLDELGIPANQRGSAPLSRGQLNAWQRALEGRAEFVRRHGGELLLAVVPEKSAIYGDRMPRAWQPLGPSRTDQFLEHMRTPGSTAPLDLRPALRDARGADGPDDFAYDPFGTHWTIRGAVAGWRALAGHLALRLPRFPALASVVHEEDAFVPLRGTGDSWAPRMHMRGVFWSLDFDLVEPARRWHVVGGQSDAQDPLVTEHEAGDLPTAVVLHDSFGVPLRRLLPRCFSRATFLWQEDFPIELIRRERPDVVLIVTAERFLGRPPWPAVPGQENAGVRRAFQESRRVVAVHDAHSLGKVGTADGALEMQVLDHGLELRATGSGAILRLPEITPTPGGLLLAIELTAERATVLDVLYTRAGSTTLSRRRMQRVPVTAGRTTVWTEIADPERSGPIALRIEDEGARWVLHSVEARAGP